MRQTMNPTFHAAEFPIEAAYHTFKDNLAKGYGLEDIRDILEEKGLDSAEVSAGLQRILFTVSEFIKNQQKNKIPAPETQLYLMDHGYTLELIKLAYFKLHQTLH